MKPSIAWAWACALLLAATGSLAAQQVIGTASGQTLQGTLLSDDGSSISFRTDAGLQMTMSYKDLDAQTIYRLMAARTSKKDGPGQLRVGDQAAAAELFDAARDAYALAEADDPSLRPQIDTKLASLRLAASNSLLAEAKHAASHDRPDVALRDLATLLHEFPDEPAAKEASAMYDTLHTGRAVARKQAKQEQQSQEVQQALAPAEQSYTEASDKIKQGVQDLAHQSLATQLFNSAIEDGKSARSQIQVAVGQAASIPGLEAAAKQLDQEVVDQMVDAYTQLANAYNQQSSYTDAGAAVSAALALQPHNQDLLQLQAQIASNATQNSGYVGWGRGRSR